MKAAAFEYERARTVAQACALLARHGTDAKLLAGGQSLVPMMAMCLARPAVVVNINEGRGDPPCGRDRSPAAAPPITICALGRVVDTVDRGYPSTLFRASAPASRHEARKV
jgi:hypothetical protein